jgi:uncharacterized protein
MDNKFFENLKKSIQDNYEPGGSHAFDHTQRVYNIALKLAKGQKVDLDVLRAAALLHDISRLKEDNNEVECHAEHGAEMARKILNEMGFPKDKIDKVCYAIKVHRHSKGINPETIEAKILQDADRLDALGAITIARMFSTGGKTGRPIYKEGILFGKVYKGYESDSTIHGFYAKIMKIKPEGFNTKKAKLIAKRRYAFVEKYLKQFLLEWEGKA